MSQLQLIMDGCGPESSTEDLWAEYHSSEPWSISGHNCFRRCQKQYFFSRKMASWKANDPQRREAFILSKLQDLSRWRGQLVDKAIEQFVVPLLKYGKLLPLEEVLEGTVDIASQQWRFSEQRRYRVTGLTITEAGDEYCALYEHEYGQPIGPEEFYNVLSEVRTAFTNLYEMTDLLARLAGYDSYRSQFRIPFPYEGSNVTATLDLICARGNLRTVVDWKAVKGETSDYTWQMLTYALAVKRRWPTIHADDIAIYEARLLEGETIEHRITEERLVEVEDFVYQSLMEIEALTGGKRYPDQCIEDYEPANSPGTCAICNFRKICASRRVLA